VPQKPVKITHLVYDPLAMSPKLGLVLSGGGARGFAHIGVILELQRAGIVPDFIVGTSIGAIVGGFYAVGQDLSRLARVLSVLDLNRLFGLNPSYRKLLERAVVQSLLGHLRGHWPSDDEYRRLARFREFLWLFCKGRRFEELERPLVAVATDLLGPGEVIIREGPLHEGILASAALPGILPPVRWNGKLLVDGGAVNNFPVDVAAEEGDVVLGVLLSSYVPQEPKSPADLILQTYYVTSHELLVAKLARARERLGERLLVVHPQVEEIGVLEFDRAEEAMAAGRRAAKPWLGRLRKILSR